MGLPHPLRVALTFLLIVLGFVLFRAENLEHAGAYVTSMVGLGGRETFALRPIHVLAAVAAGVIIWCTPTTQVLIVRPRALWVLPFILFLAAILHLHFVSHVLFLFYFQF